MGTLFIDQKINHLKSGLTLAKKRAHRGFTLVELLIVIVVIAILAAITVVAYNGVANNAKIAALKADLAQASTKLEAYKVDNSAYPPDQATVASLIKFDPSTTLTYAASNTSGTPAYCLIATQGTQQFSVSSANNTPSANACVINLAVDPRATAYNVVGGLRVQNSRYSGGGIYSLITGAADGPAVASGVTLPTYARYTITTAGAGHGFDLSGNPQAGVPGTLPWLVTAGTTYTVSSWVRYTGAVATQIMALTLRAGSSSSTWIEGPVTGVYVAVPTGQWVRISLTYTAPVGATMVAAIATGAADAVGDTWDITGLMATQSPTLYNYADGNSPGWSWSGTPNASTSFGPAL